MNGPLHYKQQQNVEIVVNLEETIAIIAGWLPSDVVPGDDNLIDTMGVDAQGMG